MTDTDWTKHYNCQHNDRDGLVCRICADTEITRLQGEVSMLTSRSAGYFDAIVIWKDRAEALTAQLTKANELLKQYKSR